jgi:hypothetical protein
MHYKMGLIRQMRKNVLGHANRERHDLFLISHSYENIKKQLFKLYRVRHHKL